MMKEIRKGLKLVTYGYGVKLNLILGFVLWLLGILLFFTDIDGMLCAATLYIMMGPLMLIQVGYTLLYSKLVAASPKKWFMEVALPDYVSAGAGLICYVIVVISTAVKVKNAPEQSANQYEMLLVVGLTIAAILVYYGTAYKYYWLSCAMFFVMIVIIMGGGIVFVELMDMRLNLVSASLICLVLVVLGTVLSCLARRGVYKKALSSMACGTTLRRQMQ